MTWTERNRYQASWGAWYVQIEIDGQIVELKFKHSPTSAEIDPIAQQVQAYVEIGAAKYWSTKTTFSVQSNLA